MELRTIDITDLDVVEVTYRLRYDLDKSYQEIADFQQVSLGTVMSRLARGRKRHGKQADWRQRGQRKTREMRGTVVHN
jgi:hypothetical protein